MEVHGSQLRSDESILFRKQSDDTAYASTHEIVVTNRKLYLYRKDVSSGKYRRLFGIYGTTFNVRKKSIKLDELKGFVIRRKSDLLGFKNYSIIFFSDKLPGGKFELEYFTKFFSLQNELESILLKYGNIQQRWESATKKIGFQFPHTFTVSPERFRELNKQKTKWNIIIIINLVVLIVQFFLSYVLLPSYLTYYHSYAHFIRHGTLPLEVFLVIINALSDVGMTFLILVHLAFLIPFGKRRYRITSRIASLNDSLTLESEKIILQKKGTTQEIELNPKLSLDYYMKKPTDILRFVNPYNSGDGISFGPLDDFNDVFDIFYCLFIIRNQK